MKKMFNIFAIFLIMFALVSISSTAQNYQWKIQHVRPIGTPIDIEVNWAAEQLKERSGGRINLTIFPAEQLGNYNVLQERVGMGEIEMNVANGLDSSRDRSLEIIALPYLVTNWEEVPFFFSNLDGGAVATKIVKEALEKQNIKLLSSWPVFFGGIILSKMPNAPADPYQPKNVKIRIPAIKIYDLIANSLNYQGTPLPWSEVYPAMQTGVVDGLIGSGAEGCYNMFKDITKYYVAINDHFETWYWYMSMDLWNSLSEEDQQLLEEVASEFEKRRFSTAKEEEQEYFQLLKDAGIEIITFTNEELTEIANKVREDVWPFAREVIGEDNMDRIMAQLDLMK